jgi:periplasmic protein TonB
MKPTRQSSSPSQPDILPSLFLQETHRDPRTFAISVLLHLCAAVIVGLLLHRAVTESHVAASLPFTPINLRDVIFTPSTHAGSGGDDTGGGRTEPLFASRGVTPPVAVRPLMTPTTHVPEEPPALAVPQTITSSSIPVIMRGVIGDPNGVRGPASDGPGHGRGIGDGTGEGIGKGDLTGYAPFAPGTRGVTMPRLIYDPDPEYTEEARRLKQQGNVLVAGVVGADGKVHDARVQHALGLGLDEKAIEAVRRWKFEPSRYNGQPVAVKIMVEVNFRLY